MGGFDRTLSFSSYGMPKEESFSGRLGASRLAFGGRTPRLVPRHCLGTQCLAGSRLLISRLSKLGAAVAASYQALPTNNCHHCESALVRLFKNASLVTIISTTLPNRWSCDASVDFILAIAGSSDNCNERPKP